MTGLVVHSARKIDADGLVDDFWFIADAGKIIATGNGTGWHSAGQGSGREVVDADGHWLTPGFIDLHCHGGDGSLFDDGPEQLRAGLAAQRAHGTTRSLVSHASTPLAALRESLSTVADLMAADPLVLGSHLEGPFLAPERRGAQDAAFLREPGPEMVEELLGAARGTLRSATVAPELPNALETIGVLTEANVVVGLGHTDADYAQAARAFEVGARMLTHAFNGMNGIHRSAPGPVVAAFENPTVTLELILDGLHLHPSVARVAFSCAPGRVALVTDAMADVSATLTQDAALRSAISAVGLDPQRAVEALTLTPARALGEGHRFGRLRAGYAADAVLLDHEWSVLRVFADGLAVG